VNWFQVVILLLTLTVPTGAVCQTGFYLSYPCKKGDKGLREFDPTKTDLCLVSSPVVTLADITSVGEYNLNGGRPMFEMRLSPAGHARLRTAVRLSTLVAFTVGKEILFILDTDDSVHETIRIYQLSDHAHFYRLYSVLRKEKNKG
jgi:hypothetical protein